jgi:hypothetical protein
VPVTAKLSRKFYETLGEDVANELVEWFNQVDATYRSDLRELNELNFSRFDAKLEQRLAESESRLDRRLAEMDMRWERRLAEMDVRWEGRLADLRAEIREVRADLIKWMFIFVTGSTFTVLGVMVAVLKL